MASNTTLNAGTAGDVIATKERTHDGDATKVQVVSLAGVTGTEGSYTFGDINGDATNGLDVDVTRTSIQGNVDTAAGATQIGVAALVVRDDALATLTEVDGDLTLQRTNARGATWVALDSTAAQTVSLAAGTATNEVVGDAAHDAAATGNPLLVGGYASAAAPTDVSGDADAVRGWFLRNGAQATVITAAGALVGGDATNGLDTDVTRVIPGTSATHLGKAVDSAAGGTDTGVALLAVRDDALTTLTPVDGDYVPLRVSSTGALHVTGGAGGTSIADGAAFTRDTTSLTPVGGVVESSAPTLTAGDAVALSITTGGAARVAIASGGVAGVVDDAAFTPGTTEGVVFMAHADETSADAVDEGDAGALRMTLNRALHTTIRCADGVTAMDEANDSVRVTVVSGSGGTSVVDDAAFTAATGSVTPIGGFVTADTVDSGDVGAVAMTTARALHVAVQSLPASTNTLEVVGDAAHDAAAAGNPVLAGGYASAAAPTDVSADADVVRAWHLRNGAQATVITAAGALVGGDATNGLDVDVTRAQGFAAQDAAVSGNPLQIGLRASTATPTAMSADGDVVYPWATREGATIVAGVLADDAVFTPGTTRVHPVGMIADETATDSVDEGDAGIPRMTLDRKVIVTSYAHAAAGGHTPYKNLDVDESEDEVKGSGGKLFWLHAVNLAATKRYLKIYNNTAAGTTVGTTVPDLTFPIPTMADTNGAGFTIHFGDAGISLGTGITVAATTGFADNDTGAPGANEVIINAGYL